MIIAIILAYPASKLKHHFLSLTTIAFGEIVYLFIIYSPGDITRGFSGIAKIPIEIFGLSFSNPRLFLYFNIIALVVFLVIKRNIEILNMDGVFIAIRDNSDAANGMGVNVRKV